MPSDEKVLHFLFSGLFLVLLFERGYFQAKAMRVSGEASSIRADKRKFATVLGLFIIGQIWVLGSFIFIARPTSMAWSRFPLPVWVRWIGLLLTISGMALEISTQLALGKNFSTTIHISSEQTLVTNGPYRYMRHPMYTALITMGIGLGLMSASWYFLLPFILTAVILIFRIPREEAALAEKFGAQYIEYAQSTGRFIPKLGRKEQR